MKTNISTLIILFFLIQNVSAQNSYIEALKKRKLDSIVSLQTNLKTFTHTLKSELIKSCYFEIIPSNDSVRVDEVEHLTLEKFNSIKNIDNLKFSFDAKEEINSNDIIVKEAIPASFSGLESMAVNALATFIAGRFKQESLHFAIHHYFKKIIEPKTESEKNEAKIVTSFFPNLTQQIKQLYSNGDSSYYSADLVYLSQVAKNDLNTIPNALAINVNTLLPNAPNTLKDVLLISASVVKDSKNGVPLNKIISNLQGTSFNDGNVEEAITVLTIISEGLRNEEGKSDLWINPEVKLNPDDINSNTVVNDTYAFLYDKLKNIDAVKKYIEKDGQQFNTVAKKIYKLLKVVNDLNEVYNSLKDKKFKLDTTEDKINYIKNITNSINTFLTQLNTNQIININTSYLSKSLDYLNIMESFMNKDYSAGLNGLLIQFSESISVNVKYSRLLNFTSQLAAVKSSEEMEKMLNSFAAPIGSSSIKRNSDFSIAINSYVGLNFGYEKILSNHNDAVNGSYFGVTAPIGFTFSCLPSKMGSWSAIITALDLGSLVNTRINNDTTTYANLKFEHFFAPGLGIAYNFKGTPLTVGAIANYISNLRDINYSDEIATITATNKDVFRLSLNVLVDIPLLNIYKK